MIKSRKFVIEELNNIYPKLMATESEDFDGTIEGIWLSGTESGQKAKDNFPLFNYYSEDYKEIRYVMGVHREIVELLETWGWYSEWHDAGTIILFKN